MRLDKLFGGTDRVGSNRSRIRSPYSEKPDLLSVVSQIDDTKMDGCLYCGKTIFFNGDTWRHANDSRACANPRCDPVPTGGTATHTHKYTDWEPGFWRNKKVQWEETKTRPEVRCRDCGRTGWFGGAWLYVPGEEPGPHSSDPVGMVRVWCPAKVATPASRETSSNA